MEKMFLQREECFDARGVHIYSMEVYMGILIKEVRCIGELDGIHDVYVHGNKIAGIDEVPEGFTLTNTIDVKNKLLLPGLINCHTHTYMSLFRNAADDLSFLDWLFGHIDPLEGKMELEDAYWGSMLSIVEMIKSGTTCFCDMHMHPDQTVRAVDVSGLRAVITRGLVGGDREDEGGIRRLNEAKGEMAHWREHPRLSFRLGPHAPYTCGEDYLKYVKEQSEELGIGLNIHLAESKKEFDDMMAARGCTPVEYLDRLGLLKPSTICAHCVQLTENDMDILAASGASVAINPASNMKLGNGFAPVPKMLEHGVNVCLGTDGAASNNAQNMFREMNLAALVYKGATMEAQAVSSEDVLAFATKNAAKALGFEGMLGEIKVGYIADLIVVDMNRESFQPMNHPASAIAYSANGSEVDSVIVNGKILMEKRVLKTVAEDNVYYAVNRIAKRLGIQ